MLFENQQIKNYNGWIILDKKAGISSFEPIRQIKKIIRRQKIGHSGTLDPFATGILPIAIGEATKLIPFLVNKNKEYRFLLKFGIITDTLDSEGEIIATSNSIVSEDLIKDVLPIFKGKIAQVPPKYSAVKIQGKRAYELARGKIEFDIKEKLVDIYDLKLLSFDYDNQVADIYVKCGSGTYIRSLGRDIATKLNTIGYLIKLDRLSVGIFNKSDAILLDNILDIVHNDKLNDYLKQIDIVLDDILAIDLDEREATKVRNGLSIYLNNLNSNEEQIRVNSNNKLVSIGKIKDGYFKPNRVFNY